MGMFLGLLTVLIPGGGLVRRKSYLLGSGLFITWAVLLEVYLLAYKLGLARVSASTRESLFLVVTAVFVLHGLLEAVLALLSRRDRAETPDTVYARALASFAAGDYAACDRTLRLASRFGAPDADFLFLRAKVALAQGNSRRAGRLLRKCRDFDEKGKWNYEVRRALEKL